MWRSRSVSSWDLRQTAQELVVENHALRFKELGRRHGLQLSIEPYDLNPPADLNLGEAADVPMCEFWSKGLGFSHGIQLPRSRLDRAHRRAAIIAAESFTADQRHLAAIPRLDERPRRDWALCDGVNRLVIHRYQHQPWLDQFPGMTFGPYGVHWERTETWWDMASAYHKYLARCQTCSAAGCRWPTFSISPWKGAERLSPAGLGHDRRPARPPRL